jgi:hypothetical protein
MEKREQYKTVIDRKLLLAKGYIEAGTGTTLNNQITNVHGNGHGLISTRDWDCCFNAIHYWTGKCRDGQKVGDALSFIGLKGDAVS